MNDLPVSTCKLLVVFSLPCPPEGNDKSSFGRNLAFSLRQHRAGRHSTKQVSISARAEGEVKACYKGADDVPALTSEVLEVRISVRCY